MNTVEKFKEFLQKNEVRTTRCSLCHKDYFPPRMHCPRCLKSDMEWIMVGNKGILLTCTEVHYAPSTVTGDIPYVLGVAEFSAGIKLFAKVVAEPGTSVRNGSMIRLSVSRNKSGTPAYEFIPE
jgi:uncharacterized protein